MPIKVGFSFLADFATCNYVFLFCIYNADFEKHINQGWIQHELVGGGRVLWCRLPSCVGHVCRPPINYCIGIGIVVHSSLIIMLLLKLLYLILSFSIYHER